jgi:hypothetical protein
VVCILACAAQSASLCGKEAEKIVVCLMMGIGEFDASVRKDGRLSADANSGSTAFIALMNWAELG